MAEAQRNFDGRPTKYKKEYCQKLIEFFDIEPYEDKEIKHFKEGKKTWTDIKRMPKKLPTLVGFARHIKVCYSTLKNWMDPNHNSYHKEFLAIVTRVAKDLQKDHLIQNGLQGLFNPQAFKFVAVNITDMSDKQDVTHDVGDGLKELLQQIKPTKGVLPAEEIAGVKRIESCVIAGQKQA